MSALISLKLSCSWLHHMEWEYIIFLKIWYTLILHTLSNSPNYTTIDWGKAVYLTDVLPHLILNITYRHVFHTCLSSILPPKPLLAQCPRRIWGSLGLYSGLYMQSTQLASSACFRCSWCVAIAALHHGFNTYLCVPYFNTVTLTECHITIWDVGTRRLIMQTRVKVI